MSVRLQFFFRFGQEFFIRQLCIESSSKMISMFSPYDTLRGYTMALSLARIKRNSFALWYASFLVNIYNSGDEIYVYFCQKFETVKIFSLYLKFNQLLAFESLFSTQTLVSFLFYIQYIQIFRKIWYHFDDLQPFSYKLPITWCTEHSTIKNILSP